MSKQHLRSAEVRLTVPFHDLDPARIVWHGNYLKYFDMARFALFKEAGLDLYETFLRGKYAFPVTKTYTKHIAPLVYGDEFICKATVVEARIKITLDFEIRRIKDNVVCARGRGDQVAIKMPEREMLLEIPQEFASALGCK